MSTPTQWPTTVEEVDRLIAEGKAKKDAYGGVIFPCLDPSAKTILNPFAVLIDTREQKPYSFFGLSADVKQKSLPLTIPTVRGTLHTGDYSIQGMETCLIERKSKEDLYGSVAKRANFVGRLERMHEIAMAGGYCCVMVECSDVDMLSRPSHSRMNAKALNRTIIAWRQRYRVDWWFISTRERAEAYTFRILERFWTDRQGRRKGAK